MNWAAEEFATVELGDKRLNKRLVKLAQQLADKPTASIPGACGGWGDTAAAYRMLDNERCDWREIIETHGRCAVQRMAGLPVVLCLHDTTELDFNGQTIEGLGPLSYEAQRGMYLHPTYAVSTDREPLGVLDAWMWAREPRGADGQRGGICESVRWIESYERLAERAAEIPETRLVQVGDRESDILGLMQRAQGLGWPVDLLVRSQHNRRLPDGQLLWDAVQSSPVLGEIEFTMGARAGSFDISLRAYGWNAVSGLPMGAATPTPIEVGLMFVATAATQALATQIAKSCNPLFFHMPLNRDTPLPSYAFPFSPAEIERGAVFEFMLNHVVHVDHGLELVRTEFVETREPQHA